MSLFRNTLILLSTCALAACGTTTSSSGAADDAGASDATSDTGSDATATTGITGVWASSFGGYSEISSSAWDGALVVKWQKDQRWAITQNASDDPYNPAAFNKVVWTEPKDGSFYTCTVEYGQVTAKLAEDTTKTADDSTPEKSGCGGFAWTKLTSTAAIEIAGQYNDNFGGKSVISSRYWDAAWLHQYDNAKRFAIMQNPANDQYNPSKFSKVVWTAPAAGSFYTCTVDYGLDSAELAAASTKTADDSAPEKSGCAGFSWTKLSPQ